MEKQSVNAGKLQAILYAVCVFLFGIGHTKIQGMSFITGIMVTYGKFIPAILAGIILLFSHKTDLKTALVVIFFTLVLLFCFIKKDLSYTIFFILFFMIACKNSAEKYIYKYYFRAILSVIILSIIFSLLKIIPNEINIYKRYDLGFTYTTFGPNLFLSACLALVCWKKNRITGLQWIFILLLNVFFFIQTNTDAVFLCVMAIYIIWILMRNKKVVKWIKRSRIVHFSLGYSAIIFCVFTIMVQIYYNSHSDQPFMIMMNKLLSTRLIMGLNVFSKYSRHIPTLFSEIVFGMNPDTVTYLDSSYLSVLTAYGIITLVIFCHFMIVVAKGNIKKGEFYIPLCIFVFMIHCITDPQLVSFRCNPIIITALPYLKSNLSNLSKAFSIHWNN